MKYKKLIVSFLTFVTIFAIYLFNSDKRLNYVALGDSVAAGQNPYGEVGYGYTDYVANYLERNNLLQFYTKGFAVSGARTNDLLQDLETNKTITEDGKKVAMKSALRDSDIVTISIGANDFLSQVTLKEIDLEFFHQEKLQLRLNKVYDNVDMTLKEVRKYAKNHIIVIGYYNPIPRMTALFQSQIDTMFEDVNQHYKEICKKYSVTYIDMYDIFQSNMEYLPNPLDIHPSQKGYEAISKEIIDILEKKILN